jgi:hypothetical protein
LIESCWLGNRRSSDNGMLMDENKAKGDSERMEEEEEAERL